MLDGPDHNKILRLLTEALIEYKDNNWTGPKELHDAIKMARNSIAQKLEAKAARIREGKELP